MHVISLSLSLFVKKVLTIFMDQREITSGHVIISGLLYPSLQSFVIANVKIIRLYTFSVGQF